MTIYPQLVNISPEIILILQNMLIYALLLIVASRIYALFVAKSTSVPGLGGGGGGLRQSWQCQDFDSACYGNPSLNFHCLTYSALLEHCKCLPREDVFLIFALGSVSRNTVPRAIFPNTLPREQGVYWII